MKISEVQRLIFQWAPPSLQEDYDNAQLICGNPEAEVQGVLCTLDCIESVVDEAIQKSCNLIIAHHPIVFRGIKSLTGKNYVERTIIKAIKNDVAILAVHTNLDNIATGVNQRIAQQLGISDTRILRPKTDLLRKLHTYVPVADRVKVLEALYEAGAGHIGEYDHCSFSVEGKGTFRASDSSNPHVGERGKDHEENEARIEVVYPVYLEGSIVKALTAAHPYEEVAYDLVELKNQHDQAGSGMVGKLKKEMSEADFLRHVGQALNTPVIRHTAPTGRKVSTVAFCGGAGGFLLRDAIQSAADVIITADYKYHEFFDAENQIMIMDVGHFESEQFTPHLIADYLRDKNVTFAVLLSEVRTNPVHYYIS